MEKSINLKNEISEVARLNKFIDVSCQTQGLSIEFTNELKLAIEEVVVNSINYGFIDGEDGEIIVSLKFQPDEVLVEIKDNGKEFDPTLENNVDIDSGLDERQIGGLGLFLVKQLSDSITYRRVGNLNLLSLNKIYK